MSFTKRFNHKLLKLPVRIGNFVHPLNEAVFRGRISGIRKKVFRIEFEIATTTAKNSLWKNKLLEFFDRQHLEAQVK